MRLLYPYLLALGWAALTGCDKSETPLQGGFAQPARRAAVSEENLCLVSTARTVDTVFSAVQLVGPYNGFTWDEISWNTALSAPGVSKSNYHCVRVFVAREGSVQWQEVPNAVKSPDGTRVAFWVNAGSQGGGIFIWAGDLQPQLGGVDLSKRIDVKVSYRVL